MIPIFTLSNVFIADAFTFDTVSDNQFMPNIIAVLANHSRACITASI